MGTRWSSAKVLGQPRPVGHSTVARVAAENKGARPAQPRGEAGLVACLRATARRFAEIAVVSCMGRRGHAPAAAGLQAACLRACASVVRWPFVAGPFRRAVGASRPRTVKMDALSLTCFVSVVSSGLVLGYRGCLVWSWALCWALRWACRALSRGPRLLGCACLFYKMKTGKQDQYCAVIGITLLLSWRDS